MGASKHGQHREEILLQRGAEMHDAGREVGTEAISSPMQVPGRGVGAVQAGLTLLLHWGLSLNTAQI